ncbi:Prophage Lp2 protein 54 [Lactiplantibacillus plantarum]|nr:Prophage Lp2 protein 54 [Lactiplantibacillus plantarum]
MIFDLSKFLTEGLIDSINNGLIPSDLATVYAGNYLVKSLITQTQVTQVSDAIVAYKAAQAEATAKASTEDQEVAKQADSSLAAQTETTVDHSSVK